jgi:cell wall assembly regulator SMI1
MCISVFSKFQQIVSWYSVNAGPDVALPNEQSDGGRVAFIEQLVNVELPRDIRYLYERYDGETDASAGCFAGHGLMSIEQVLDSLEISLSFRAPPNGTSLDESEFASLLDSENFTSFPTGAIKLTYFNPKWVPIIQDFGGSYIGIDLDPGPTGRCGQVIVFGSDEDDMYVLADSWEQFLDLILEQIDKQPVDLLGNDHLHDYLKPIVTAKDRSEHG